MTASSAVPFSRMDEVKQIFLEIYNRRIQQAWLSSDALLVRSFITDVLAHNRFHLLRDKHHFEDLWKDVRKSATLTDFVMAVTSEFHFRLSASPMPFKDLATALGEAYSLGSVASATAGNSAEIAQRGMDVDLMSRIMPTKEAPSLIQANPWVVTLMLIEQMGFSALLHMQGDPPGEQKPKA